MTLALALQFKLAGPRGDGRHPYVNSDGAFIGRGVPLLQRDALGRWQPRDEAVLEQLFRVGYISEMALCQRSQSLRQVAAALNDGNIAFAGIVLLQMQLPPLPSARNARAMAAADGLLIKDNPDWEDEPRVPAGDPDGGEWTTDDDGDGGEHIPIEPTAAQIDATQARKERFVDAHLTDTEPAAERIGIPVENILALSALESDWGRHPFAAEHNNFFGIHYPAPYATGYVRAGKGPARVATFATYADSLRSFEAISGRIVRGIGDPEQFAAALQDSGKFGIDPATGRKMPSYVGGVAGTIRGLRSIVARRRL